MSTSSVGTFIQRILIQCFHKSIEDSFLIIQQIPFDISHQIQSECCAIFSSESIGHYFFIHLNSFKHSMSLKLFN